MPKSFGIAILRMSWCEGMSYMRSLEACDVVEEEGVDEVEADGDEVPTSSDDPVREIVIHPTLCPTVISLFFSASSSSASEISSALPCPPPPTASGAREEIPGRGRKRFTWWISPEGSEEAAKKTRSVGSIAREVIGWGNWNVERRVRDARSVICGCINQCVIHR